MSDKDIAAQEIVKTHALYAAGAGLIPVPVVDFAAITALELKMLRDLGNLYGVEFHQDRVRPIVASLIGGYTSTKLGYGMGGSALKSVPFVGQVMGMLSMPAFGAGLTYAIGKVFIQHFASGGTFLDFNTDKVRKFFTKKPAEAKAAAEAVA
jgi:uncharacterized protein (DUF697 family)